MTTKYIVNNLTGQTITGDLTITGNLKSNNTGTYRALLTETGSITGTSISDYFNYGLIIGEQYTITNYQAGDDFSNIANVINGNINQTGCVFIATGETPSNWFNGSQLVSLGYLVVNELQNTLGFGIDWSQNFMGGSGFYFATNDNTGPIINTFPIQKTSVKTQNPPFVFGYGNLIQVAGGVASLINKNDVVFVSVYDWGLDQPVDNALYYTPVEITIEQDLDTTPVNVFGATVGFPFSNVAYDVKCGDNVMFTNYSNDGTMVNNMEELVNLLNDNSNTNQLGVFSVGGGDGGIKLTMAKNLENQICPDNDLTFVVFND